MSAGRRRLLVAAYAATTFLAFPHPIGGRVLDLGAVTAWLGPALLVLALEDLEPRRAGRWGFAAGLAAHTAILHWIYVVTVRYGGAPAVVGLLAPVALAAYIAAFVAAFSAGFAWLARRGLASAFAAAALWTALEHLRCFALSGFPWALLGYAQHLNPALLALAPWTGVLGLSFATVLGGAALARGGRAVLAGRRPPADTWLAAAAIGVALLGGALAGGGQPAPEAPSLRVAVIQGNIDQGIKWSPDWAQRTLGIYEQLSRQAVAQGAEVVIWPETAVPGALEADGGLAVRISELAQETGAAFVVGGVGLAHDAATGTRRFYDSAFLLDPDGRYTDRYDKSHLVPFGEYVPLRDLFGLLVRAVASGIAPDNVTAGAGPRSVGVATSAQSAVTAGVPICYELIFPDLVRRFVRDGGGVLFAITNDAWYGRTGAPYQFLAMTALRSAETRVWTARAANTGISAIIDHAGRVRERTRIFERGYLVAQIPVSPPGTARSFYVRYGDVFAYACWIGVAALGIAGWRRAVKQGGVRP